MPVVRYLCSLEPKTLSQALDDASLIKPKPLELCLPWAVVLTVVTSYVLWQKLKLLLSLFVSYLINYLSTVSIDSYAALESGKVAI